MASNSTGFEPRFVPEPTGRGTVGILWSCLVTLGLCIWTAVHTDVIPARKRGRLMHKCVWMFYCLVAPEVVIVCALKQWLKAKRLHRAWCKYFRVEPGSKEDLMGIDGAFYVVMGGFVICKEEKYRDKEWDVWDEEEREALEGEGEEVSYEEFKPEDFTKYLESGMIHQSFINRRLIADKGKADTLAKTLVCIQALWMVIQCAARKAGGLPITLLELHVLIQVAFVLAMYGLWWNKPLGVNEPIVTVKYRGMFVTDANLVAKYPGKIGIHYGLKAIKSVLDNAYSTDASSPHIITVMCLLTSASHAVAWNYHFPTPIEGLLWKISSLILGAVPFAEYVSLFLKYQFKDHKFLGGLGHVCYVTFYLVYGFGIGFITVESFLSMRKLPEGSYATVPWIDFWPHI